MLWLCYISCICAPILFTQLIKNKLVADIIVHSCYCSTGEVKTERWMNYRCSQSGLQRETLSQTNTNKFGSVSVSKKKLLSKSPEKRKHEIHFMLVNYSWVWDLPLNVVDIFSETTLRRLIPSFPESFSWEKLLIVLRIGLYIHLFLVLKIFLA